MNVICETWIRPQLKFLRFHTSKFVILMLLRMCHRKSTILFSFSAALLQTCAESGSWCRDHQHSVVHKCSCQESTWIMPTLCRIPAAPETPLSSQIQIVCHSHSVYAHHHHPATLERGQSQLTTACGHTLDPWPSVSWTAWPRWSVGGTDMDHRTCSVCIRTSETQSSP